MKGPGGFAILAVLVAIGLAILAYVGYGIYFLVEDGILTKRRLLICAAVVATWLTITAGIWIALGSELPQ